jgi:hypothetical protein
MLPKFFRNVSHVARVHNKERGEGKNYHRVHTTHIFHSGLGKSNITTERMGEPLVRERHRMMKLSFGPKDFEECSPGANSYYCEL